MDPWTCTSSVTHFVWSGDNLLWELKRAEGSYAAQAGLRNRYYDPATGQFTQTDPIGLAGGLNAYGFAAGDPVSYSDPYGLSACLRGGLGARLAVAAGADSFWTDAHALRANSWHRAPACGPTSCRTTHTAGAQKHRSAPLAAAA